MCQVLLPLVTALCLPLHDSDLGGEKGSIRQIWVIIMVITMIVKMIVITLWLWLNRTSWCSWHVCRWQWWCWWHICHYSSQQATCNQWWYLQQHWVLLAPGHGQLHPAGNNVSMSKHFLDSPNFATILPNPKSITRGIRVAFFPTHPPGEQTRILNNNGETKTLSIKQLFGCKKKGYNGNASPVIKIGPSGLCALSRN